MTRTMWAGLFRAAFGCCLVLHAPRMETHRWDCTLPLPFPFRGFLETGIFFASGNSGTAGSYSATAGGLAPTADRNPLKGSGTNCGQSNGTESVSP